MSMQRFCGDIAFPIDPLFRGEKEAIGYLVENGLLHGVDATQSDCLPSMAVHFTEAWTPNKR